MSNSVTLKSLQNAARREERKGKDTGKIQERNNGETRPSRARYINYCAMRIVGTCLRAARDSNDVASIIVLSS